ncbi:hypothetical protein M0813_30064 [Anaeramoeba flamelloides]|uniref:SEC7 domain-containing protein n=1 Tax=Anaeramoeba flamelloides TaxID=1746091 RepID=A0ABQ8XL87_9EUKA|nr:hypothetical protein M0813_30064 [Anaeramoeba flamelloides]
MVLEDDKKLIGTLITEVLHSFIEEEDEIMLLIIQTLLEFALWRSDEIHDALLLKLTNKIFYFYSITTLKLHTNTCKLSMSRIIKNLWIKSQELFKKDRLISKNNLTNINTQNSTRKIIGNKKEKEKETEKEQEKEKEKEKRKEKKEENKKKEDPRFNNIYEKDIYLIFKSLCMELNKKTNSKNWDNDEIFEITLRKKLYSYELILEILNNCGKFTTKSYPFFFKLIQKKLFREILKSGSSTNLNILQIVHSIFLKIYSNYRYKLKKEIYSFLNKNIISFLKANKRNFVEKIAILKLLYALLKDPKNLIEIYFNYDYVSKMKLNNINENKNGKTTNENKNIFEQLVQIIANIINGNGIKRQINSRERYFTLIDYSKLRNFSFQLVIMITRSMYLWCNNLFLSDDYQNIYSKYSSFSERGFKEIGGEIKAIEKNKKKHSIDPLSLSSRDLGEQMIKNGKINDKITYRGILLFNEKSKNGINFLIKNSIIKGEPDSIYKFLKNKDYNLKRAKIGEYLGNSNELNQRVLNNWMKKLDFTNLNILNALSLLLKDFSFPNNLKKIDQILIKFAECYCLANPNNFKSSTFALIFIYQIINLYFNLKNPIIIQKITKENFMIQNKKLNPHKNFSKNYILEIYEKIYRLIELENKDLHNEIEKKQVDNYGGGDEKEIEIKTEVGGVVEFDEGVIDKIDVMGNETETDDESKGENTNDKENDIKKDLHNEIEKKKEDNDGGGDEKEIEIKIEEENVIDVDVDVDERRNDEIKVKGNDDINELIHLNFSKNLENLFLSLKIKYSIFEIKSQNELNNFFLNKAIKKKIFYPVSLNIYIKSMISINWEFIINCFIVILNKTEDPKLIKYGMTGFRLLIKLTSKFFLLNIQKCVVKELIKSITIIKSKNITKKKLIIIDEIIHFCINEGMFLGPSWEIIFSYFFDLLKLGIIYFSGEKIVKNLDQDFFKEKNKNNYSFSKNNNIKVKNDDEKINDDVGNYSNDDSINDQGGDEINNEKHKIIEINKKKKKINEMKPLEFIVFNEKNIKIKIKPKIIEEIFQNSNYFNNEIFLEFFSILLQIAEKEHKELKKRIPFFLQKAFDVIYYNMSRTTICLSRILEMIFNCIKKIINQDINEKQMVLMFYLNSLRKISKIFLNKPELLNYQLQLKLLEPYNYLIQYHFNLKNVEYALKCVHYLIIKRNKNLKSGWIMIFNILISSIKLSNQKIINYSFRILSEIYLNYFHQIKEHFILLVNTFFAFVEFSENSAINLNALDHISKISQWFEVNQKEFLILNGNVDVVKSIGIGDGDDDNDDDDDVDGDENISEQLVYKYWFPFYIGLSKITSSTSNSISNDLKKLSNKLLFEILERSCDKIGKQTWKLIFKTIIIPIFDDVISNNKQNDEKKYSIRNQSNGNDYGSGSGSGSGSGFDEGYKNKKEDVNNEGEKKNGQGYLIKKWIKSMHYDFFQNIIDLIIAEYDQISFLIGDLLSFFELILKNNPCFGSVLIPLIDKLIEKRGKQFNKEIGTIFTQKFSQFLTNTLSKTLLDNYSKIEKNKNGSLLNKNIDQKNVVNGVDSEGGVTLNSVSSGINDFVGDFNNDEIYLENLSSKIIEIGSRVKSHSSIHLNLLQVAKNLFKHIFTKIGKNDILLFVDSVKKSFQFARNFQNNYNLRILLFQRGFITKQIPNLLHQEYFAKKTYLYFINLMFKSQNEKYQTLSKKRLLKHALYFLKDFNQKIFQLKNQQFPSISKNIIENDLREQMFLEFQITLTISEPLVVYILEVLLNLDQKMLTHFLSMGGYTELTKLFHVESSQLLNQLVLLLNRIGKFYNIPKIIKN